VLEGDREIALTDEQVLPMRVAGMALQLRPQGFFQTNTPMAAELYHRAAAWVGETPVRSAWDLYCGVGGFALALALHAGVEECLGVEVSAEAVAGAAASAAEAGRAGVRFEAGDAIAWAQAQPGAPDLVVVNPPRRGIGPELAGWLEASGVPRVLYSSCNARTLAQDLEAMPSLRPVRGQVLDMFPNTAHYEVLTLLERR
jgi:23S rRNA (uracil747-C5)-methyltransferase